MGETQVVPEWCRKAILPEVLSKEESVGLFKSRNMLVCGGEESNIPLLTILQQLAVNSVKLADGRVSHHHHLYKVVYLIPTSDAAVRVAENLSAKLTEFGTRVRAVVGDDSPLTHSELEWNQVIVTTPEVWEMTTRRLGLYLCVERITLLIIGGVHLLPRDPVLQIFVARSAMLLGTTGRTRFVGLSAVQSLILTPDYLADRLNAEIVLGTVSNVSEACTWLRYIYQYVEMEAADLQGQDELEKLKLLIINAAKTLATNKLIEYDEESEYFLVTELGKIASYYYISHWKISAYDKHVKPTLDIIDFDELFSSSQEFDHVTVREDQKEELETIIAKFPEKAGGKIDILLAACCSGLKVEGLSLPYVMVYNSQCAQRLLRAIFKIILWKRGSARLAVKTLNLCKMFNSRNTSCQTPLNLSIEAHVHPITCAVLRVELTVTPNFQWKDEVNGCEEPFWIIVEEEKQSIHHEYFLLKKKGRTLNFTVEAISGCHGLKYSIRVVSDRCVGAETVENVCVQYLELPTKSDTPPIKLADLNVTCVEAEALQNQGYQALYGSKEFNCVQSKMFKLLYKSDDNVLIAAPAGWDKSICAEFAVFRNHQKVKCRPAVFITPIESLAKERHTDWHQRFEKYLKLCVVELTGEIDTDLKLLKKGQIIISTTDRWEALCRSREGRMQAENVGLYIIDEVQLIGGQNGSLYEYIVSRIIYISRRSGKKIRIVALSSSLANADDVGEWIGATSDAILNISPLSGPVPLELDIRGVDLTNFETVMHALAKSTYTAIGQHWKPALVYVPGEKHVQVTALDLVACSDADSSGEPSFSLQSTEEAEEILKNISDETLKRTLRHGVGYLHEDLDSYDRDSVLYLFRNENIHVCVMTGSMCGEVPLSSSLVVVMGTEYDEKGDLHFEYPLTDLFQMMDHAGQKGAPRRCVIFCQASRRAYYKTFLHGALTVESRLQHYLQEYLNAEVVAAKIEKKQDAFDLLTCTFLYQRHTKNPRHYDLQEGGISKLLSDSLDELEKRGLISNKDGKFAPQRLGVICSEDVILCSTAASLKESLSPKASTKDLLEILACAFEYSQLPLRPGEEEVIQWLIGNQRFPIKNGNCRGSHVKANALLQAYFSRHKVYGKLLLDQYQVLLSARRLLSAIFKISCKNGRLNNVLCALSLMQMVSQGIWPEDSMLLQLPHFTKLMVERCEQNWGNRIYVVSDLVKLGEDERHVLLGSILEMSEEEMDDIQTYCTRFPDYKLKIVLQRKGNRVTLEVEIIRQLAKNKRRPKKRQLEGVGVVDTPRFPQKTKEEQWWLVVGDTKKDSLLAIQKVPFQQKVKATLQFIHSARNEKECTLYLISDSRMGCDKRLSFD